MRILVTAGPTREYLDDVRYLSNDSSGRMGYTIAEAAVAAREVEDNVAGDEPRAERDDELGAVREIGVRVRVGRLRPALGLRVVLLGAQNARSRSGCLRTKRRSPLQCQSVRRSRNRRSLARSYACVTTAPGTYHRSQPAFAAR